MLDLEDELWRRQLLDRVELNLCSVPQFCLATKDIVDWAWPTCREGIPIAMACFGYYRSMHRMQNPLCICARNLETCTTMPEAAVYVAQSGQYQGYWVAGCARGRCGYLVCLDSYFHRNEYDMASQYYELRAPPRVKFVLQPEGEYSFLDTETLAWGTDVPGLFTPRMHRKVTLPIFNPPQGIPSPALILRALNAPASPGLSIEQILELIVECYCGMVVSRDCFHAHICLSPERGATAFSEEPREYAVADTLPYEEEYI